MSNILRGQLCFKGDRGKDAYEISILGGTQQVAGNTTENITKSYPDGFTRDNTIIISKMLNFVSNDNVAVTLGTNDITISIKNTSGNTEDIAYKIAVMKIE